MGARMALRWKCKTQASEAKGYELLCLAAEQLRGAKKAPFTVECTISEVKGGGGSKPKQIMSEIHFSDRRDIAFLILGTVGQVVTTSTNLAGKGGLLEKMGIQPAANFRRGIRFEGLKFAAGDFLLSVAQASNLGGSKQFMGVVAEVEYIPVCSIAMAKPILEEFLNILASSMRKLDGYVEGTFYKIPDQFSHFKLCDQFSHEHAAVQYILLCKALSK